MTTTAAAPLAGASGPSDGGFFDDGHRGDDPFHDDFFDDEAFDPEFEDPPPPPAWVLRAFAERDREQLARAATHAVDAESLTALANADPSTLDADALLDAIAAAQRLINHTQALQQRYLAALARPGVATPLGSLVRATLHPTGQPGEHSHVVTRGLPSDLPVTEAGDVDYAPLLAMPAWRDALIEHAARFASADVRCLRPPAPAPPRHRIETAVTMVDKLPATLAAQQRGDLDGYRASIIADCTSVLSPERRCEVERRVLPLATGRTSGALRRIVHREVIAADPVAAEHRARYARARRGVTVDAAEDGMSTLRLFASAADTALVHGVLDSIATSVRAAGFADGRGASQMRADAMVDLFRTLNRTGHARIGVPCDVDGADDTRGMSQASDSGDTHEFGGPSLVTGILPATATTAPRGRGTVRHGVTLNVYVDAATLAGLDDKPGELAGLGAITADTARELARSAGSVRAIVVRPAGPDRACGTVLDAGRRVYRPPTAVADYVTVRDRTCQFPGCRAPASRCDIDHRRPFEDGGDTCPHNLDLLCRAHHRLKTFTRWHAEPTANGNLAWTSPLGRTYVTESGHLVRDRHPAHGSVDDPPPF
jgi:hypothetical protein